MITITGDQGDIGIDMHFDLNTYFRKLSTFNIKYFETLTQVLFVWG